MKKYTFIFAIVFMFGAFISNVFAGGGFDTTEYNPDGTIKTSQVLDANGNPVSDANSDIDPTAQVGGVLGTTGTRVGLAILFVIILAGIATVGYKSIKKNEYKA
jgi:hypothetical protein